MSENNIKKSVSFFHSFSTSLNVISYFFFGSSILYCMNFLGIITTTSGPINANFLFSNKTGFFDSFFPMINYYNIFQILKFSITCSIEYFIEKFIKKNCFLLSIEKLIKKLIEK